jgi:translation initiation factor IF-2
VADIGLLVVSSVDGVKPQTKESLNILKEAKIPFIVVLTKIDLEASNPLLVKQQIMKEGIALEGYGGDVPVIEVSAKANRHIKDLLDLILLVFDIRKGSTDLAPEAALQAVVIESRLDQRVGPRATVVIKNGTLRIKDEIFCEHISGRVRSLIDTEGRMVQAATIGDAVEILGFMEVPPIGGIVRKDRDNIPAKQPVAPLKREVMYLHKHPTSALSIILVCDALGSLEAIEAALPKDVEIVSKKIGEVTENDVLMAKSTGSVILSFNTRIRSEVMKLAQTEKVIVRNYQIIYEMLSEIADVLEGKKLAGTEQILGKAEVLALFPYNKQTVLGIKVIEGRIARGDKVRIIRGEEAIGEATIISMRIGKEPTSKVEYGKEAGILLSHSLDFRVGDVVLSHT